MAQFFAPSEQFYGEKGGRKHFDGGIAPLSAIENSFNQIPGFQEKPKVVLTFFESLGICRLLGEKEARALNFREPLYEFPDLAQVSELAFLPYDDVANDERKVVVIALKNISAYQFSKIRRILVEEKDPNFVSFLNSVIVTRYHKLKTRKKGK